MKTEEEYIKEHCNTEYHKTTGELMVYSSEAAVVIAMQEYAKDIAVEFAIHMCYKLIDDQGNFDIDKADGDFYDQWIKDQK